MVKKLNHAAKGTGFFVRVSSLVLVMMIVCTVFAGLSVQKQSVKAANVKKNRTGAATDYSVSTIGNTRNDIYWTNATYFDYLSDTEMTRGWLNADQSGTGFNGSSDDWYPFSSLNSIISGIAANDSNWSKPLYFGNYCNTSGSYDTSTHNGAAYVSGMTKNNIFNNYITPKVRNFNYAANNSNGLSNLHQSYQKLMQDSLVNKQLMATSSTPAPYFNASALTGAVKTVDSLFPFRTTKSAGGKTTYYSFDSNNAKDNVYFTWQSTGSSAPNDVVKPIKVNYGTGTANGVEDGLKYFMDPNSNYDEISAPYNSQKYYGIFPFNNRKNNGDNRTTATNTRYLYASKDNTSWGNIYCYFYNSSGDVGPAFPGTKMEAYLEGGNNRRVKIPDAATGFVLNNGYRGEGNQTADNTDLDFGAYYIAGGDKYVYLSKDNTGWGNTYCYFFDDSGPVGTSWPGYSMVTYSGGGNNLRVKTPVGAKYCVFHNNAGQQTGNVTLTGSKCAFWLSNTFGVNPWNEAPEDAGISTGLTAQRWDSRPTDAGKASPGNEALDYGFGIRMDMKFRVPNGGRDDDGKEVKFSYSGDDDLWVYITDREGNSKLVLDLGGNHKKATGTISFLPKAQTGTKATCTAVADNVYGSGRTETDFDFDYSQTYTMSIFYMERGMFESNCQMSFSMTLPENDVIVDKTVNTSGVNSAIRNSTRFKNLVKAESFNFTSYENNAAMLNTPYAFTDSSSGITNLNTNASTGVFPLKDQQSADFVNQFKNGRDVYVKEAYNANNKLSYSTTWKVKDVVNNGTTLGSGSGLTSTAYPLKDTTTGADPEDYAELQYSFTNRVRSAPLEITKTVKDYHGNDITSTSSLNNDTFSAEVEVDLGDGGGYQKYNLSYTDSDGNTGTGSTITLKNGRTVTITGIPVNAKYKVTETVPDNYTNTSPESSGTMSTSGASVDFTNTEKGPNSTSATIKAKKSFKDDKGNDVNFSDDAFKFDLYSGTNLIQSKTVSGSTKEVSFDAINYTDVGTHTYTIKETQGTNGFITYDSAAYTVTVTVTKSGSNLVASTIYDSTASDSTPPTFNNVIKTGSVLVDKSNQAGGKMQGVTFKVFKVTQALADADSSYATVVSNGTEVGSSSTGGNGKLSLDGLPIYENNTYNAANPAYQYYALIESSTGNANYRLNRVVKFFCFDDSTNLTKEFSYVNGHLRTPTTAGEGMAAIVRTGLLFIMLSGVSAMMYYFIKRPKRKKLAHLRA
jgi:pilin isopeptide linkage protein/fibro-slime domain-containing protein